MKTTLKITGINLTIEGNPVAIENVEIATESNAQELATTGGNLNHLVELIGEIAERFDTDNHMVVKEIEAKPVKVEPVKVKEPITDFREVKEKPEKPELPTSEFHGGEPVKKRFNITKAWRAIPVPEELKPDGTDKYHWEGENGVLGDSVTINGQTFGSVYIHIYGMKKRSFIIVRNDNVEFEDDIEPEEFNEFLNVINIPGDIKEYIRKVVEL